MLPGIRGLDGDFRNVTTHGCEAELPRWKIKTARHLEPGPLTVFHKTVQTVSTPRRRGGACSALGPTKVGPSDHRVVKPLLVSA